MDDICINNLYVTSSDTKILEVIRSRIESRFDCYFVNDKPEFILEPERCYEIEFGSVSVFPRNEVEAVTDRITDTSLYIQVISYERKQEYIAFNIYKYCTWRNVIERKSVLTSNTTNHE